MVRQVAIGLSRSQPQTFAIQLSHLGVVCPHRRSRRLDRWRSTCRWSDVCTSPAPLPSGSWPFSQRPHWLAVVARACIRCPWSPRDHRRQRRWSSPAITCASRCATAERLDSPSGRWTPRRFRSRRREVRDGRHRDRRTANGQRGKDHGLDRWCVGWGASVCVHVRTHLLGNCWDLGEQGRYRFWEQPFTPLATSRELGLRMSSEPAIVGCLHCNKVP